MDKNSTTVTLDLDAIEARAWAMSGHPVNVQPHEAKVMAEGAIALVARVRELESERDGLRMALDERNEGT